MLTGTYGVKWSGAADRVRAVEAEATDNRIHQAFLVKDVGKLIQLLEAELMREKKKM